MGKSLVWDESQSSKTPQRKLKPHMSWCYRKKNKVDILPSSKAFLCRCVFLLINKSGQRRKMHTHTHSHSTTVCFQPRETTMKIRILSPFSQCRRQRFHYARHRHGGKAHHIQLTLPNQQRNERWSGHHRTWGNPPSIPRSRLISDIQLLPTLSHSISLISHNNG